MWQGLPRSAVATKKGVAPFPVWLGLLCATGTCQPLVGSAPAPGGPCPPCGEQAGVPALKGGKGHCPLPTGRYRATRDPAAAHHTRWCRPPVGLVVDRRPVEGSLVLVGKAQDRGMNPTPAYTMATVGYFPTAQPPRVLPLCDPLLMPHLGVFPRGGGGAKAALPGFWPPTGGQPTACTLALWWLKFGLTEGFRGGGGTGGRGYEGGDFVPTFM